VRDSAKGALVYKRDSGDFTAESEEVLNRRRKLDLIVGVGLLAFAFVGAALAQTISLNTNDRVEFGQGSVTLKACDSFISISLNPSAATFSGVNAAGNPYENASRVKSMQFSGLDTRACAGRSIKVELYIDNSTTPMAIYSDTQTASVDNATLVIDPDKSRDRADVITLLNGLGQNIGQSDTFQSLTYNSSNAVYTLEFFTPLALVSDVSRVSVETTRS
jgi:hypothetical protein